MSLESVATGSQPHPSTSVASAQANVWRGPSWAVLVGSLVLAVYLLLLPLVAQTWQATGDEPHYLLAAHSLAIDGDFDLSNNYTNRDYLNFYVSRDIVPQVRLNAAGQQLLDHYPALPVLTAPAYGVGRSRGRAAATGRAGRPAGRVDVSALCRHQRG